MEEREEKEKKQAAVVQPVGNFKEDNESAFYETEKLGVIYVGVM